MSAASATDGWVTLKSGSVLMDGGLPIRVSIVEPMGETELSDGSTSWELVGEPVDQEALRAEVEALCGRRIEPFDPNGWDGAEGEGEAVCSVVLADENGGAS